MRKFLLAAALIAAPASASAQDAADPLVGSTRALYESVKRNVIAAAEQMPEEHYAFRPTEEVRRFGQLMGHIANAHYSFCSSALAEPSPMRENLEQTKTTKADIVAALKDSFTYCDRAYNTLTDAQAAELTKVFGADHPRLYALTFNVAHDNEHYGNIVTYMRMKGLVPPSSQRGE